MTANGSSWDSGGIGVQPLRDIDTPEGMAAASGWLHQALEASQRGDHVRRSTRR